jgi:hypothetical protein
VCSESARPSFVLLLYPVIDLSDDAVTHRGLNDEAIKQWPEQALRFMARHRWIPESGIR